MDSSSAGTPRARTLAALLRQKRDEAGMTQRELARQLQLAHTTIGRWESGKAVPNAEDVSAVLACLQVTGEERERILSLARTSPEADWLVSGPPGISPQLAGVMECERTALSITEWAPLVVPGVLQTSDYARTIITRGSSRLPQAEIETRVMMRLARRDAITRRVQLLALIGEPAIRGQVGGPKIMAVQLRHLLSVTTMDTVEMRVVSLAGDWHPGHAGGFILYEFDKTPPIVYLEHHRSGAFLVDKDDVGDYQTAAETIRRAAMSPDESAGLIADVIPTMETTENDGTSP